MTLSFDYDTTFKKELDRLVAEDDTLEGVITGSLKLVGNMVGAREVSMTIIDSEKKELAFQGCIARNTTGWKTAFLDTECKPQRLYTRRYRPAFLLRSIFCFRLDLPRKWMGTLYICFPGIRMLTPEQHKTLSAQFSDLSDILQITLLNREMENLKVKIEYEEMENRDLRRFMANLSKELFCLSSVSTVLGQSHDVSEILSRVLETTLPLLKADFGSIYVNESDQCVSFLWKNNKYKRFDYFPKKSADYEDFDSLYSSNLHCLKEYFSQKMDSIHMFSEGIGFKTWSIYDSALSPVLKQYLEALDLKSCFEFYLRSGEESFGSGLIGFTDSKIRDKNSRLFMITLNMIGLFLENIYLMRNLERQVKLKSQEILELDRRQRFLSSQIGFGENKESKTSQPPVDWVLQEVERSRKMAMLGELASGIAHQIRNPLNHMVGALHLLKQEEISTEEKTELFFQMEDRVENITRMVNEFIQYTRFPELKLTRESINRILENALESFRGWFDLAKIECVTMFDKTIPPIQIDLYLISQVFHNIIKNALEAVYEEGTIYVVTQKLTTTSASDAPLEFVEITFRDSGIGIDGENLDKVFTPFFSRKKDGLGLGMSIVEHILRSHGGGIQLKSYPGKGTSVILYLPVR